jgi:hypothetical protein
MGRTGPSRRRRRRRKKREQRNALRAESRQSENILYRWAEDLDPLVAACHLERVNRYRLACGFSAQTLDEWVRQSIPF